MLRTPQHEITILIYAFRHIAMTNWATQFMPCSEFMNMRLIRIVRVRKRTHNNRCVVGLQPFLCEISLDRGGLGGSRFRAVVGRERWCRRRRWEGWETGENALGGVLDADVADVEVHLAHWCELATLGNYICSKRAKRLYKKKKN